VKEREGKREHALSWEKLQVKGKEAKRGRT
jgi:hypothetical protein